MHWARLSVTVCHSNTLDQVASIYKRVTPARQSWSPLRRWRLTVVFTWLLHLYDLNLVAASMAHLWVRMVVVSPSTVLHKIIPHFRSANIWRHELLVEGTRLSRVFCHWQYVVVLLTSHVLCLCTRDQVVLDQRRRESLRVVELVRSRVTTTRASNSATSLSIALNSHILCFCVLQIFTSMVAAHAENLTVAERIKADFIVVKLWTHHFVIVVAILIPFVLIEVLRGHLGAQDWGSFVCRNSRGHICWSSHLVETTRVWSTFLEELLWNFSIYKLNAVLVLRSNVQIGSKVDSLWWKTCFVASTNAWCVLRCFYWRWDTHQISIFFLNCLNCVSCTIPWLVCYLMLFQKLTILVKKLIRNITHCFNLTGRLMHHFVACWLIRETFLIHHGIYILSLHFFLCFFDSFNAL